jgi:OmpA-OmpF porin, OOP family
MAAGVVCVAGAAQAQDKTFYLDRLSMGGAPDDAVGLWRPELAPRTRFHGQLGAGFAVRPLRVDNHVDDPMQQALVEQQSGAPVSTQLVGYLDLGVQFLQRFAVAVELPVIAAQTGNPTRVSGTSATESVDMTPAALMDVRLDARAVAFRSDSGRLKLGVMGSLSIPTGNEYAYGGDGGPSGGFGLAGEVDLGRLFVVANTGLSLRPPGGVNDLVISSEWRWGAGVFVPLRDRTLRLGVQLFGSTGIDDGTLFDADNTPLEWLAEARLATDAARRGWVGLGGGTRLSPGYAPDARVVAVVGYSFGVADVQPRSPHARFRRDPDVRAADSDDDGLPDDIDLCPNDPEDGKQPNTDDGCPALDDADGDGIPTISDRCPHQAEDFDKVRDKDGCPEEDPDMDGIADAVDECPTTPGWANADPERHGCPRHIDPTNGISLIQQVQFETNKSRILPGSFEILDEVARILAVTPEIEHVTIEGHTDDRGPVELNERLSQARAESVLRYLVEHGIAAARLTAKGFGPQVPIADNRTAEGRRKNRRVEFKHAAVEH